MAGALSYPVDPALWESSDYEGGYLYVILSKESAALFAPASLRVVKIEPFPPDSVKLVLEGGGVTHELWPVDKDPPLSAGQSVSVASILGVISSGYFCWRVKKDGKPVDPMAWAGGNIYAPKEARRRYLDMKRKGKSEVGAPPAAPRKKLIVSSPVEYKGHTLNQGLLGGESELFIQSAEEEPITIFSPVGARGQAAKVVRIKDYSPDFSESLAREIDTLTKLEGGFPLGSKVITIEDANGAEHALFPVSVVLVKEGQKVTAGEHIGEVAEVGTDYVIWRVFEDGKMVNPLEWLRANARDGDLDEAGIPQSSARAQKEVEDEAASGAPSPHFEAPLHLRERAKAHAAAGGGGVLLLALAGIGLLAAKRR